MCEKYNHCINRKPYCNPESYQHCVNFSEEGYKQGDRFLVDTNRVAKLIRFYGGNNPYALVDIADNMAWHNLGNTPTDLLHSLRQNHTVEPLIRCDNCADGWITEACCGSKMKCPFCSEGWVKKG